MPNPKKRGRPKKTFATEKKEGHVCDDEIILHLPIKAKDIITHGMKDFKSKLIKNDYEIEDESQIEQPKEISVARIDTTESKKTKKKDDIKYCVCHWCTYEFDTTPFYTVERLVDGIFYISGNFCSGNCMIAHNFSRGDYRVWDRFGLSNALYTPLVGPLTNIKEESIIQKRESFDRFGGTINIDMYRANCLIFKGDYEGNIRFNDPMMKEIVETPKYFGPSGLKIKRTKPLPRTKGCITTFLK